MPPHTPDHLRFVFSFAVRIDSPTGPQFLPLVIGRYGRSADRRPELVPPDRVLSGEFQTAAVSVEGAASVVAADLREFGRAFGATGAAVLSVTASRSPAAGHPAPDATAAVQLAKVLGVR